MSLIIDMEQVMSAFHYWAEEKYPLICSINKTRLRMSLHKHYCTQGRRIISEGIRNKENLIHRSFETPLPGVAKLFPDLLLEVSNFYDPINSALQEYPLNLQDLEVGNVYEATYLPSLEKVGGLVCIPSTTSKQPPSFSALADRYSPQTAKVEYNPKNVSVMMEKEGILVDLVEEMKSTTWAYQFVFRVPT